MQNKNIKISKLILFICHLIKQFSAIRGEDDPLFRREVPSGEHAAGGPGPLLPLRGLADDAELQRDRHVDRPAGSIGSRRETGKHPPSGLGWDRPVGQSPTRMLLTLRRRTQLIVRATRYFAGHAGRRLRHPFRTGFCSVPAFFFHGTVYGTARDIPFHTCTERSTARLGH